MQHTLWTVCVASALALVTACAVGPNYRRPEFNATPTYKEENGWKPSEPADTLDRGPWWQIFHDDLLSSLEEQVNISNENIKAAEAAFEESRALVRQAQAGLWPSVSVSGARERTVTGTQPPRTLNDAGVSANWDLDIWGQIRRTVESNRASAQASAATLAAARLSAQAELATDYFQLRAQDQLQVILDDIVAAEQLSLKITENRYRVGVAAKADVVTAQTQLLSSQAQQVSAPLQRAILEHAIAVLVGQQPASFSVPVAPIRTDVPTVPAGVPSTLLERRPDVAEAERRMAAANAQIGVTVSAFFPSLTLSGSDDYTGNTISRLIRTSNRVWQFGPSLALSVFDAGLRRAQVAQARAAYEASVDNYRQTVLAGIQQVEDEIATLRILEQQAVIEDAAVKAAREAETLTLNQYKAGTVPYSSVITAQTTRLVSEETALGVLSGRLQASVSLIEAVGGGWKASDLPR
ncbi:MAG TPA: efflux transporter outer membrane subunit [Steroidobacteraceae bacterium]|nr:efflux transporter outer membrane subunit [Steroidobacteraceae bacterium]